MQRLPLIYFDVPALRPGTLGAYGLAFVTAAIATALHLAIEAYVVGVQYVMFFAAVTITSLIGGLGAGLFCLVLSVGATAFFFFTPRFSFYVEHLSDLLTILLFILMTFSIVILIAGMRFAIERCQEVNHSLGQHAVALQQQSAANRETEERLTLTAAELQHRTRNLISVVGTLADNTLRKSKTFDDFKARYHERLQALGRAQGLLSRKKEGRVTFDELLNAELSAQSVRVGENGSVTLDGPKGIPLRSGTVQTLAMVMHELVANAVKHGALKQPNGHLTVRWHLETRGEGGKPWLHLDWKESGVEMPRSPQATGQGRTLIEQALPYQFGAHTTFASEVDGVRCTISLPISEHEVADAF